MVFCPIGKALLLGLLKGVSCLYTYMCQSSYDNRTIIKYEDDLVIVSLLQEDEISHGPVVNDFVHWCEKSYLRLNISKNKDAH